MSNRKHPYNIYETHPIWPLISESIDKLVKNGDLIEQTDRSYIVGFFVQELLNNDYIKLSNNLNILDTNERESTDGLGRGNCGDG
jgi:hypothetical protein